MTVTDSLALFTTLLHVPHTWRRFQVKLCFVLAICSDNFIEALYAGDFQELSDKVFWILEGSKIFPSPQAFPPSVGLVGQHVSRYVERQ